LTGGRVGGLALDLFVGCHDDDEERRGGEEKKKRRREEEKKREGKGDTQIKEENPYGEGWGFDA
jgi:hypothetical protein